MRDFLFPGVMRRLSSAKKDKHRQIQELVFSQTSLKIYGLYRDDGGRKMLAFTYNLTTQDSGKKFL